MTDREALERLVGVVATSRRLIPRGRSYGLGGMERQVLAAIALHPHERSPRLADALQMSEQRVRAAAAELVAAELVEYDAVAGGYLLTKSGEAQAALLAQDARTVFRTTAS